MSEFKRAGQASLAIFVVGGMIAVVARFMAPTHVPSIVGVFTVLACGPWLWIYFGKMGHVRQELEADAAEIVVREKAVRSYGPPVTREPTRRDLVRFIELMFLHQSWSLRTCTSQGGGNPWLLPDAKWVSDGIWRKIMPRLEACGILSEPIQGTGRKLLVDTPKEALELLRGCGGAVVVRDVDLQIALRDPQPVGGRVFDHAVEAADATLATKAPGPPTPLPNGFHEAVRKLHRSSVMIQHLGGQRFRLLWCCERDDLIALAAWLRGEA